MIKVCKILYSKRKFKKKITQNVFAFFGQISALRVKNIEEIVLKFVSGTKIFVNPFRLEVYNLIVLKQTKIMFVKIF